MDRVEQKRKARHIRSKANRHDRFISSYVMSKNKDVYAKAKKLYDELNNKYPTRRDLTKTDEFVQEITGYTSIYQWNLSKLRAKKEKQGPNNQRSISLEIPLMSQNDVDITVMSEKVSEEISIPDNIYDDLVIEISNDPTMGTVFNDLNNGQQKDLDEILDELDDILPAEKSPLEDELENIVYE